MKLICNYISSGLCLAALLLLPGCFPEGVDGCPEDMMLGFYLDDRYDAEGNYDTRVGNEAYVYVFQDQHYLTTISVPYEEIRDGREFVYRKYEGFEGSLDMVGCAVPVYAADGSVPDFSAGGLTQPAVELSPSTRGEGRYQPASTELYMGNISSYEKVDEKSHHKVPMGVSVCRVEVNLTDLTGSMASASETYVEVSGTMTQMTLLRRGAGSPAVVLAGLKAANDDGVNWNTGRFGVLPSMEGQTVSVAIYSDEALVTTLDVPRESLPKGAESGGLMIFDYTLGEAHYYLTIDGFTEKVVIVDEI